MKMTAFERLAREVCREYGFCGSRWTGTFVHFTDFLPETGPVTAEQFSDWLLIADDYNPETQAESFAHFRRIFREVFIRHMGADSVDASLMWFSAGNKDGRHFPRRWARTRPGPAS